MQYVAASLAIAVILLVIVARCLQIMRRYRGTHR